MGQINKCISLREGEMGVETEMLCRPKETFILQLDL
jgi:hypothetical protein